jgi:preprotein translocase subunit SecE
MARDRQRARDRKRRAREGNGDAGLPADQAADALGEDAEAALPAGELEAQALAARGDIDGDGDVDAADDALLETEQTGHDVAATRTRAGAPTTSRGGPRVFQFLRASWAELQRVQWPDRRQVAQATAVVLGFVVIAGAYLGVADYVAKQLVDFIL